MCLIRQILPFTPRGKKKQKTEESDTANASFFGSEALLEGVALTPFRSFPFICVTYPRQTRRHKAAPESQKENGPFPLVWIVPILMTTQCLVQEVSLGISQRHSSSVQKEAEGSPFQKTSPEANMGRFCSSSLPVFAANMDGTLWFSLLNVSKQRAGRSWGHWKKLQETCIDLAMFTNHFIQESFVRLGVGEHNTHLVLASVRKRQAMLFFV